MHAVSSVPLSLAELVASFNAHAERRYRRRSGAPTREHLNWRSVLARFEAFAGSTSSPAKINRHQVRAWLDQLAAEQLSRTYINQCLARLRRFIRWAADLDYVPITIDAELRLVRPLAPLSSKAREPEKPTPPHLAEITKLLPHLPPLARDVLQLSKLTGARPSELLELTNAEVHIDPRGSHLAPLQHKSAHHGRSRIIPLNDAAVLLVEKHWRPLCPADSLFTSPRRSKHGHYTIEAYRAAIHRACKRAGVQDFTPYDVRRAVARDVRRRGGLDAAQALLGHADASTTEIYAPIDAADSEAFTLARRATEALQ
jgi:integrase